MTPDEFRTHGHALIDWIAEYLEAAIRHRFGVCANVEFLFPGRLRERSGIPATWPWSVEEATWMILAALDDVWD